MSDVNMIELTYEYAQGDLGRDSDGLTEDDTFKTAILMSLLSNARADPEEALDRTDLGGWWGNSFPDIPGAELGSKLWLLATRKTTDDTLTLAEQYGAEALDWMKEDGITDNITVIASRVDVDVLDIEIQIERPDLPSDVWLGVWIASISGLD